MKLTSKFVAGAVVLMAMAGLAVSPAAANLIIDLRFTDGTTTKDVATLNPAGQDVTVNVWARITGTSTTGTQYGLQYLYFSAQSVQHGDGTLVGGPGVGFTQNLLQSPFNVAGASQTGAVPATPLTNDQIADWGDQATSADSTQAKPANALGTYQAGGGAVGEAVAGSHGWEFLIGQLTFHTGQLNSTALGNPTNFTEIDPLRANWGTGLTKSALWQQDGTNVSSSTATFSVGTGVQFITGGVPVPEPATMLFLAMGGIGMIGSGLARRRNRQ